MLTKDISPRRQFRIEAALALLVLLPAVAQAQFSQQGSKLVGSGATGTSSEQGTSVAVSADGTTAVVGAPGDDSHTGAVWIFTRSGTTWSQQGDKLVGTGGIGQQRQGQSVAISADGNTVLVGGLSDNFDVGAAWVFTRTGSVWSQQGNKLTSSASKSRRGSSVALSADGNTAIVGGLGDNGFTGAAWVYTRSGIVWTQGPKLVGTGFTDKPLQGSSVALSSDGNTAIIGGPWDDDDIGAAWVFTRSGSTWTQQGSKLVGTDLDGTFTRQGGSVALSADGNTALVGGYGDANSLGAAWVWTRSGSTWTQQGSKLVGSGADGPTAWQGFSVSLSSDGNTALVGGYLDEVVVEGLGHVHGATWVWTRSGSTWTQQGNKLVGTGGSGRHMWQGYSVSLSADGYTAVIGGPADNSGAGATWVFAAPSTPSPLPGAPTGVTGAPGPAHVSLSWTAPATSGGSAITGYQVQMALSAGGVYSDAAGCPTNSTTTACTATGLTNGTTYFFKVAAINAAGTGPFSFASAGVTAGAAFTDSTLVPGVTPIKGIHITELRTRVNALRTGHGLAVFSFTDTNTAGTTIQAVHILELRTALHAVYLQMALTPPTYATTPAAGVLVAAADIDSLRAAVQAIE